ncbi:MAG: aldehyde dehydrogenase family protein, partial [Nitrososphaerota archaeon]
MYDEFLKKFVVLSGKLSIGNPANADMRPLINMDAVNNVNGFVEEAIENGGKNLVVKSVFVPRKDCTNGSYTRPAVIEEAGQKSKLFQEEVFGAMIGAIRVSTKDEFFELANDSKYGLALYLFTKDLVLAQEASEKIRFGELYINMPGPEASQGYHT